MRDFHHIDAFAAGPFSGNPAAVIFLEGPAWPDVAWMQAMAAEAALSETAFVLAPASPGAAFGLRWFTPKVEVALCGHATLASAHTLFESGRLAPDAVAAFETKSGLLKARKAGSRIALDFPALAVAACQAPPELLESLGLKDAVFVGRDHEDYLVEAASEQAVRGLAPDFAALAKVECRGVCVCARASSPPADFVSRFFGPRVGVNEDPVTGSAHCRLGPYWGAKLGKTSLLGRQLSARGGEVGVELKGERLELTGRAFTIWKGQVL